MLASDVITRARYIVQDESSTRWNDTVMLALLNDGQNDVWQRRADLRHDANGDYVSGGFTAATATGDTLDVDGKMRSALAHYVAARCFEMDGDDQENRTRANDELGKYEKELAEL